jgi:hypothetical protein
MFIPDPDFINPGFRIPNAGSQISDPGSQITDPTTATKEEEEKK